MAAAPAAAAAEPAADPQLQLFGASVLRLLEVRAEGRLQYYSCLTAVYAKRTFCRDCLPDVRSQACLYPSYRPLHQTDSVRSRRPAWRKAPQLSSAAASSRTSSRPGAPRYWLLDLNCGTSLDL
jgi:hypothetical protein